MQFVGACSAHIVMSKLSLCSSVRDYILFFSYRSGLSERQKQKIFQAKMNF